MTKKRSSPPPRPSKTVAVARAPEVGVRANKPHSFPDDWPDTLGKIIDEELRRRAKVYGPDAEGEAREERTTKQANDSKSFFSLECPGRGAYDIAFDTVKEFQHLLLALRKHGTVPEVTEKIDAVKKTIETSKKYFPGRVQTVYELEDLSAHLDKIKTDMEELEVDLASKKWKIDPKTGTAVSITTGHRGRVLLAECVRRIYAARPEGVRNTTYTRKKIADVIASLFDAEELREDAKGPIYRAIDKEKRRSRK